MPNDNPWFKCYPRDFLDGVEEMSCEEIGLYCVLLMRIYETGRSLPFEPRRLGMVANLGVRKATDLLHRLIGRGKLILLPDGRLSNPRAELELDRQKQLSHVRAQAASAAQVSGKGGLKSPRTPAKVAVKSAKTQRELSENMEETAENSQSAEANAPVLLRDTHARAPASEPDIERREEESSPLTPPQARAADGQDFLKDDDEPEMTPERKAEIMLEMSNAGRREMHELHGVDIPALTGWIMKEARMVVPPMDLALVGSWVRFGVSETDIRRTVTRLAASAKQPPRMMRYFDETMRALRHQGDAQIEEFERMRRRMDAVDAEADARELAYWRKPPIWEKRPVPEYMKKKLAAAGN